MAALLAALAASTRGAVVAGLEAAVYGNTAGAGVPVFNGTAPRGVGLDVVPASLLQAGGFTVVFQGALLGPGGSVGTAAGHQTVLDRNCWIYRTGHAYQKQRTWS